MTEAEPDPGQASFKKITLPEFVGYGALVDGLKLKPKSLRWQDPNEQEKLIEIADTAPSLVEGLRSAGEYVDPSSVHPGDNDAIDTFLKQRGAE